MKNTIDVKNLSVSYYGKNVLNKISFSEESGKLIGIIGPNGAGKSTLMKGMLGLIPIDSGQVTFLNQPKKKIQKKIAYVPQRNNIDWDFPIIVKDAVLLGTYPRLGTFKRPGKKEKAFAMACLEKVGMEAYADRQIGELSGGQQQRVFLARALAQDADLFFLDEPFVGIDVNSEEIMIDILRQLREEGKTIFIVHHDLSKVENYFDDIILINKKLYGAGAVKDVFQKEKIQKCFQVDILNAELAEVGV